MPFLLGYCHFTLTDSRELKSLLDCVHTVLKQQLAPWRQSDRMTHYYCEIWKSAWTLSRIRRCGKFITCEIGSPLYIPNETSPLTAKIPSDSRSLWYDHIIVEPNEGPRDWQNWLSIPSFRYTVVPRYNEPLDNECFLWHICSEKQILPRIFYYLRTAKNFWMSVVLMYNFRSLLWQAKYNAAIFSSFNFLCNFFIIRSL